MRYQLKLSLRLAIFLVVSALLTGCSSISPAEDPASQTMLAQQMEELQKLKSAEYQYEMQAMACEESNRKLGNYYSSKGSQTHSLISQMEDGKQVNDVEIARALDDSDSVKYFDRPPMPRDY